MALDMNKIEISETTLMTMVITYLAWILFDYLMILIFGVCICYFLNKVIFC